LHEDLKRPGFISRYRYVQYFPRYKPARPRR